MLPSMTHVWQLPSYPPSWILVKSFIHFFVPLIINKNASLLQKWYAIILCCHSNRRVQTLMVSWLWRRVIYGINLRVLVAMVTELCTHFILQWYEMHTMLCNGMKCIQVLILKSQRHTFSQTNNFSQIKKLFSLEFGTKYMYCKMNVHQCRL